MLLLELYWSFIKVGLFCVGGGYASMPLIQAEVVDTHAWLTMKELIDVFAISQMTPGPIGINAATFVGVKLAGPIGAIVATLGFVTPSVFIMYALAVIYTKYGNLGPIKGILNGIRPAVVALIAVAGVTFIQLALGYENSGFRIETATVASIGVLLFAWALLYKKGIGIISNLTICGLLGVILGSLGLF